MCLAVSGSNTCLVVLYNQNKGKTAEHLGMSLADQPIQETLIATAKLDCLSAFQQTKASEIVLQLFVKVNTKGKHFQRDILLCIYWTCYRVFSYTVRPVFSL